MGIDPRKVNLSKIRADHLFYRSKFNNSSDPEDFQDKEIEICLWSSKRDSYVPGGMQSLVLRVNMPYSHFKKYWKAPFKRKGEYNQIKKTLVDKLIDVVEEVLPGLKSAIIVEDAGTPLTYFDFTGRHRGSVAGWTRDLKKMHLQGKYLHTSVENLLFAGIYSMVEPFLGGVPVSIYTGNLAAERVLATSNQ